MGELKDRASQESNTELPVNGITILSTGTGENPGFRASGLDEDVGMTFHTQGLGKLFFHADGSVEAELLNVGGTGSFQTMIGRLVCALGTDSIEIPDFTNSTHSHTSNAGGGSLSAAAITSGTMAEARLGTGTGTAAKVLRGDSTWRLVGLTVTFHAISSAQATWTNMPAAEMLLYGHHRHVLKADLTGYTQCRLHLNKMGTAGHTGSKIELKYSTTFATTAGSYSTIGSSAVECVFTGTDVYEVSSWIDLAAGAKADVFLAIVGSGGNGIVGPQYGAIQAEFR